MKTFLYSLLYAGCLYLSFALAIRDFNPWNWPQIAVMIFAALVIFTFVVPHLVKYLDEG